jgi:hypothetical protein
VQPNADPHECVKEVINIVSNTISAVASEHLLYLNLTAGRDTRKVLACARSNLDKIKFFTFFPGTRTVDSHIASLLASRFKLEHILLPEERASKVQVDEWLFRVGHCVSGKICEIHPTQRHLDASRVMVPGMSGEIEKPLMWRNKDHKNSKIDAKELLTRYNIPAVGKILFNTHKWLEEISDLNTFLKLGLMSIEQSKGCWGGPQAYGADNFFKHLILPFSHRKVIELVLSLPTEYRRNYQFTIDLCQQAWPELLSLPFNEFQGLKGLLLKSQRKVTWYSRRLNRGLRKICSS